MEHTKRNAIIEEMKKNALQVMPETFLQPAKKRKEYCCPACNKGATIYANPKGEYRLHCFKCGADMDIIDIVAATYQISTADAFEVALKAYGYTDTASTKTEARKPKEQPEKKKDRTASEVAACRDYILKASKQIESTQYLVNRGISYETAKKYGVGYDKDYNAGYGRQVVTVPAVVIPYTRYDDNTADYLWRLTIKHEYNGELQRYRYRKNGGSGVFNAKAITRKKPVFIVEGAIDAMSIAEAGGNAVAIQSTGNARGFIKWLSEMQKQGKVAAKLMYICLDNDGNEATKKAVDLIKRGLDKLSIENEILSDLTGTYKDANEALQKDRAFLISQVSRKTTHTENKQASERTQTNEVKKEEMEKVELTAEEIAENKKAEAEAKVQGVSTKGLMSSLYAEFERMTNGISTGLEGVDKLLHGGLRKGLYLFGGESGAGKTTLALQMADCAAGQGKNVVYVSLDMDKYAIIAKSLSRITFNLADNRSVRNKEDIKDGAAYAEWVSKHKSELAETYDIIEYSKQNENKQAVIDKATEKYSVCNAGNMFIFDGRTAELRPVIDAAYGTKEQRDAMYSSSKGTQFLDETAEAYEKARNAEPGTLDAIRYVYVGCINKLLASKGEKIDVLFVDYLQRVKTGKENQSDRLAINEVISVLQNMSKDYCIPVVLVSSLSREAIKEAKEKNKEIDMQSFTGSGGIEYGADYMLGIVKVPDGKKIVKRIKFKLMKNRIGDIGDIYLTSIPKYNVFLSIPEEDNEK